MSSTRNTPNRNAEGPKATGTKGPAKKTAKKAAAKKAPAKKSTATKAAERRADDAAPAQPEATEFLEIRRGNRVVCYQQVRSSSITVSLTNGKISVSASTADAPEESDEVDLSQPVPAGLASQMQPGEPPSAAEFDAMVENAVPNAAVEFINQDPRVQMQIHEGAVVAQEAARASGADTKDAKGK